MAALNPIGGAPIARTPAGSTMKRRLLLAAVLGLALASMLPGQVPQQTGEGKAGKEASGVNSAQPLVGWEWANFALLVLGLGYLTKKHLPPFLRARTEGIQRGITDASKMKSDAEARAAEMDRRLAGISNEIGTLRSEARAMLERESGRIRSDTERQVRRIHDQAAQEIEFMTKGALQEMKRYSAELALDLARRRIAERMNPDTQRRLVNSFLAELRNGRSQGVAGH